MFYIFPYFGLKAILFTKIFSEALMCQLREEYLRSWLDFLASGYHVSSTISGLSFVMLSNEVLGLA